MKKGIMFIASVLLIGATSAFAQDSKTVKCKVSGNCGMCEERIEKAAKGVDGVETADWNKETKVLEVTFNKDGVTMKDVEKAVAAVGHDTEHFKAENSVYDGLPACCKYDRTEKKSEKGKMKGSH